MSKRITISIDEDLETRLRYLQAKLIAEKRKSVSFSNMLTEVLKEGLRSYELKPLERQF